MRFRACILAAVDPNGTTPEMRIPDGTPDVAACAQAYLRLAAARSQGAPSAVVAPDVTSDALPRRP